MACQGTRSEASIDIQFDDSEQRVVSLGNVEESNSADSLKKSAQTDDSPSDGRKRKRLAPPSTPKLAEGWLKPDLLSL